MNTRPPPPEPLSVEGWRAAAAAASRLGRYAEAKRALTEALKLQPDDVAARLELADVFYAEGDYARAERECREVLRRRPDEPGAHRGLIDAVWMRTGDLDAALDLLDGAIRTHPRGPSLLSLRVDALRAAGHVQQAWAEVRAALESGRVALPTVLVGVTLALDCGEDGAALELAQAALAAAPDNPKALDGLCRALLALGHGPQALEVADRLRGRAPDDQEAVALWATAARLAGHPGYPALYDYAAFVRPSRIEAPAGWRDLPSYLGELAAALRRTHRVQRRPLYQTLRGGSQTPGDLSRSPEPAVQAFFRTVAAELDAYTRSLGPGDDPMRRRNTGRAQVHAAWSVMLQPEGFHVDHVHPQGWISSAFYVETPERALDAPDRQGWIQFGRPGVRTRPSLPAEHFVRPEPGTLVLFPSYMWHGTVPFSTDESRLTIAFDAVPA